MFKFGTIGAFKQVRNNPRCKAAQDLLDGQVVIPNDATGVALTPANAGEAQGDVWVVGNLIDKPEIRNKADFKVLNGEHVRAFRLSDVKHLPIELCHRVVTGYDAVVKGDVLVPAANGSGNWVKTADASAYEVSLKVIELSTFGDKGVYVNVQ